MKSLIGLTFALSFLVTASFADEVVTKKVCDRAKQEKILELTKKNYYRNLIILEAQELIEKDGNLIQILHVEYDKDYKDFDAIIVRSDCASIMTSNREIIEQFSVKK